MKKLALLFAVVMMFTAIPLQGITSAASSQVIYLTRDVENQYIKGNTNLNRRTSEHFQIIWGNSDKSSQVTEAFLEGNLRHLEACWSLYIDDLGFEPPSQSTNTRYRDGNHYKVNIVIMGTGIQDYLEGWAYAGVDPAGYGYLMMDPGAMAVTPPSLVAPHEFGHVVVFHQLGWSNNDVIGPWHEAVANWFREQFIYSDYYKSNGGNASTDFFEPYIKNYFFTPGICRAYYEAWPILEYLTENPDNLNGYGRDFVKKMLQEAQVNEYIFDQINRLAPNAGIKDTLGHYAKRMATYDFEQQSAYRGRLNQLLSSSWIWQQVYTMPKAVAGKNNTYAVPTERAPQNAGFNIIPFDITGGQLTVTLNGTTTANGADWRACIVIEDSNGKSTYSDLFKSGETQTLAVPVNAVSAYVTVIATPDPEYYVKIGFPGDDVEYGRSSATSEGNMPFASKPRYPYQITVEGAAPKLRIVNSTANGSSHPNGGGFVASTAMVEPTVYVGPNAKVLGNARVTGNARIEDYGVVERNAVVSDNAVISGFAIITERGIVKDNAYVGDYAMVKGGAWGGFGAVISGNAKVIESALVYDTFTVTDNAVAKGVSFCHGEGVLSGQAMPTAIILTHSVKRSVRVRSAAGSALRFMQTYVRILTDYMPDIPFQTAMR